MPHTHSAPRPCNRWFVRRRTPAYTVTLDSPTNDGHEGGKWVWQEAVYNHCLFLHRLGLGAVNWAHCAVPEAQLVQLRAFVAAMRVLSRPIWARWYHRHQASIRLGPLTASELVYISRHDPRANPYYFWRAVREHHQALVSQRRKLRHLRKLRTMGLPYTAATMGGREVLRYCVARYTERGRRHARIVARSRVPLACIYSARLHGWVEEERRSFWRGVRVKLALARAKIALGATRETRHLFDLGAGVLEFTCAAGRTVAPEHARCALCGRTAAVCVCEVWSVACGHTPHPQSLGRCTSPGCTRFHAHSRTDFVRSGVRGHCDWAIVDRCVKMLGEGRAVGIEVECDGFAGPLRPLRDAVLETASDVKYDGSLCESGVEIVTQPLAGAYRRYITTLGQALDEAKPYCGSDVSTADAPSECEEGGRAGVHIHVDAGDLGEAERARVRVGVQHIQEFLLACQAPSRWDNGYCRRLPHHSRYALLSGGSYADHGTIEFRLFSGPAHTTIRWGEWLHLWADFCTELVEACAASDRPCAAADAVLSGWASQLDPLVSAQYPHPLTPTEERMAS